MCTKGLVYCCYLIIPFSLLYWKAFAQRRELSRDTIAKVSLNVISPASCAVGTGFTQFSEAGPSPKAQDRLRLCCTCARMTFRASFSGPGRELFSHENWTVTFSPGVYHKVWKGSKLESKQGLELSSGPALTWFLTSNGSTSELTFSPKSIGKWLL